MLKKADYFDRGLEEERWNYVTHGIGLILMLFYVINSQDFSGKVLPGFLGLTFLASVLYHSEVDIPEKEWYRRLDMASIYLAIGATSSVYCYTSGSSSWTLLAPIGFLLFVSSLLFYGEVWDKIMVPLSVVFASLGIILFSVADLGSSFTELDIYFYVGNVLYSLGLWFYVRDGRAYFHTIWHIFSVMGAVVHCSYYFTP